jgi:hypothetical protein
MTARFSTSATRTVEASVAAARFFAISKMEDLGS